MCTVAFSKGVGFTVSKGGTGIYNITFNTPHPSTTYMISTALAAPVRAYVLFSNTTAESIRFSCITQNAIATDVGFHFQVFL